MTSPRNPSLPPVPGRDGRHVHVLPPIPVRKTPTVDHRRVVVGRPHDAAVVNAVATCECGTRFVTQYRSNGYTRSVQWVRLRWWHRTALLALRAADR